MVASPASVGNGPDATQRHPSSRLYGYRQDSTGLRPLTRFGAPGILLNCHASTDTDCQRRRRRAFLPAARRGAPDAARPVVPQPHRSGRPAQAHAAQRPQGSGSGLRLPRSGRGQRSADLPAVREPDLDRLRGGAVPARHHGQPVRLRQPRVDARHRVPQQVAGAPVPARVRPAHLVQPLRLRAQPHLPPPLHPAPDGGPRGGAAARTRVPGPVRAAAPDLQRHRRAAHQRVDAGTADDPQNRTRPDPCHATPAATRSRASWSGWRRSTPAIRRSGASRCAGRARCCCSTARCWRPRSCSSSGCCRC